MFHLVSFWFVLGEPNIYLDSGVFYKKLGRLWRVSDCEELVGGYLQEMMGLVLRSVIVSFHLPTSY